VSWVKQSLLSSQPKGFVTDSRQSDFALWSKSYDARVLGEIGIVTTGFAAPDGSLTAAKYSESGTPEQMSTANIFGIYLDYSQANTFRDNWLYTFVVSLKPIQDSIFYLDFGDKLTGAFFDANLNFCVTDGGRNASCRMSPLNDGWFLCEVTKTLSNATQYTSICAATVSGGIYNKFKVGTVGDSFLMANMSLRIGR
jgi:hypothetical protein